MITDPLVETQTRDLSANPVVISVEGLKKSFNIPLHRVESFKERTVHPLRKTEYRELKALDGIDFEVRKGEFFGIVGRNGSGKSTLLKILASIYRADAGSVKMAGRLAPFIELGVGFNHDLTAHDNVIMNGVMMGLSRQEAAARLDRVVEFAELDDFKELKLKNYSSGMLVRLAFSLMIQADADIMLIDEVLAVGDASFQQKCADVFNRMRDAGKTIVLVTHDMAAVESFCDRAMLIEGGHIVEAGEPRAVARAYLKLNFDAETPRESTLGFHEEGEIEDDFIPGVDIQARLIDSWLENEEGKRVTNVEIGDPLRLNVQIQALRDLNRPLFTFQINDAKHTQVTGFNQTLEVDGPGDVIREGERVTISGEVVNRLTPGRYLLTCWVNRNRESSERVIQGIKLFEFVVYGMKRTPGLVEAEADLDVKVSLEDD
ncbi:MAG: ABC transporter ATP-binding protein [Solirubrobacterales bacterium]|nr:ABC transporter ATP-binding protein [Solirubrobacterales bacterium]HRV59927.1 ABC transporter ATP-binding protein [Solirubrobacterales bacterium]